MKIVSLVRDLRAALGLRRRAKMLEPGDPAPDSAARSLRGEVVRLAEPGGRTIAV